MPDFSLEDRLPGLVAGLDEAGRGPWAGPVVAGAVILDRDQVPEGLDDSKRLSAGRRDALFGALETAARIGVGIASVAEIDRLNILGANDLAMRRAVAELVSPDHRGVSLGHQSLGGAALGLTVMIDGNRVPSGLGAEAHAVVKGDQRSLSIAAASIVAKVTRDRIMDQLAAAHPGYGWETNRGYGTAAHRAALLALGVTREHRRSFRPIHNILYEENSPII
ncbi:MAG: ribonuclease HII [Pseudomonadota bacterium]